MDRRQLDVQLSALCPLHFADRILQHFQIELKADLGDVAALRCTEHIAGATDLKIAHGNFVAAAERRIFTQGVEALALFLAEQLVRLVHEIGVGDALAAPDTAFQLIELRHAEMVSVVDDHRVDVRHIDAVSMIVVQTRMSASCFWNFSITSSSADSFILPWPMMTRAFGKSSRYFAATSGRCSTLL